MESERKRFPLPVPDLPNPVEALERFNQIVKDIDELAGKVDRTLSAASSLEPSRIFPPPMRLKEEYARELIENLDKVDEEVGRGLELLKGGKIREAAVLLTEASERVAKDCPPCSDVLRKSALEASLAAVSRNLGDKDWRGYLARAEETLTRFRREAIPRVRRSIEVSR